MKLRLVVVAAASIVAAPALAQTTVGPGGSGNNTLGNLGSFTQTFGQTLTSPGGNLTGFTFSYATLGSGGTNVQFGIAALNGTTIGTSLYNSGDVALQVGTNTFSGFSISTVTGQTYVGYLTTAGVTNPVEGARINYYTTSNYAGGELFIINGGSPNGQTANLTAFDSAFTATFASAAAAAPEPASWALMIGGFGVVGGAIRSRRHKALLA